MKVKLGELAHINAPATTTLTGHPRKMHIHNEHPARGGR